MTKAVSKIAAAVLLLSSSACAALLYSTDPATDELVRIDSTTGAVTVIGALGFDALDVDLTSVGGQLFALNNNFDVRVDLHEINPVTGAATSSAQVTSGGNPVLHAEGLGHVGSQLKIGFRNSSSWSPFASNVLGDLSTGGSISNVQVPSVNQDFDALGYDESTGRLYSTDSAFSATESRFYRVNESPLSTTLLYNHVSNPFISFDDLVGQGNTLFAIGTDVLYRLDLSTNAFTTIPLNRTANYSGLALVNDVVVPEPSSLALLVSGGLALLASRRKKRKPGAVAQPSL